MASVDRVTFRLAFEGIATCWKDADVGAIDVSSSHKAHFWADTKGESALEEGPLTWYASSKDPYTPQKFSQQIAFTPAVANTIELTARVFETYLHPHRATMDFDGHITHEMRAKRHDIPVTFAHAPFKAGEAYVITISVAADHRFKATLSEDTSAAEADCLDALAVKERAPTAAEAALAAYYAKKEAEAAKPTAGAGGDSGKPSLLVAKILRKQAAERAAAEKLAAGGAGK